jgi:hypothetical protein
LAVSVLVTVVVEDITEVVAMVVKAVTEVVMVGGRTLHRW